MFEKTYLIIIIILQAIISGFIFIGKEGSFRWSEFFAPISTIAIIIGFFVGYYKLKKEITFKKKLDVHEKISDFLVEKLFQSLYELYPFINNVHYIEKSNPKVADDFFTKLIKDHSSRLIEKMSRFQTNFQMFYEFFNAWKALFSEKVDKESRFLFDLYGIFSDDLNEYQRKLQDYSMLSLMKNESEIEDQRKKIIALEDKLIRKNNILANGLMKFVSDMSGEVFDGLCEKNYEETERLFAPEIENLSDSQEIIMLTERGFEYSSYKQSKFQKKFGGFKERRQNLRKFLEK